MELIDLEDEDMVVVKIELWPGGFENRKREIGRGYIWNKCTGTATKGNYGFQFLRKGKQYIKDSNVWKSGDLIDFPRKQLLSYDLLYRALKSVLQVRND